MKSIDLQQKRERERERERGEMDAISVLSFVHSFFVNVWWLFVVADRGSAMNVILYSASKMKITFRTKCAKHTQTSSSYCEYTIYAYIV